MKNYMKKVYNQELRKHLERCIAGTEDDLEYFVGNLENSMREMERSIENRRGRSFYGTLYNSEDMTYIRFVNILKDIKDLKELERELNYYKALLKELDGENNE